MKNKELFDLITQLKVDDEYVEKALTADLDSRTASACAGKTRITPIKMIAPIAACLAVFAATGLILVNKSRLPVESDNASGSAASIAEITENNDPESTEPYFFEYILANQKPFPANDPVLVEECKDVIKDKYAQVLQEDTTWQTNNLDIDFDDLNELLLCPRINGRSIKGVGVCVFKRTPDDGMEYIGSFGSEFSSMNIDNFYFVFNDDAKNIYYFNNDEENEKCVNSTQMLFVDENTNTVCDQTYLRLVKTYPNDASSDTPYTETAYRYGDEIDTDLLLSEWRTAWGFDDDNGVDARSMSNVVVPTVNDFDVHCGMSEYVQLLVDKYNVPLNGSSPSSLHRTIQSFDINGDGSDETVIQFKNCDQLPGIYVFSADGRLIGELDLEGELGKGYRTGRIDTIKCILDMEIHKFENGSESYYYYHSTHYEKHGYLETAKYATNKIVVNADGTLSTEKINK